MEDDKVEYVRSKLEDIMGKQFPKAQVSAAGSLDYNTKKRNSAGDVSDFHIQPNAFHTVDLDSRGRFSYDIASTMEPVKLVHKALMGAKYDTFLDSSDKQTGFTVRGNAQELADAIKNYQRVSSRINTSTSMGVAAQLS